MNVARWDSSIDDVEPDDARQRAARDDDVVERGERRPSAGRPPGRMRPVERHPLLERVGAGARAARGRLELVRLGLGQEADLAEVDAEDRHVDLGHGPDRAQERAVAAEHHEHVGRRRARASELAQCRPPGDAHCSTPCIAAPAGRALAELEGVLVRGVVREPDALQRVTGALGAQAAATASSIRSSSSAHDGPACEVDEELAVALRALDRRRDDRARAEPELGRGRAATSREDAAVDRADRARRRPSRPPGRPRTGASRARRSGPRPSRSTGGIGPSTSRSEMNETSTTARSAGSGRIAGGRASRALTRSIETTRGSAAQPLGELPVARRPARRRGVAPRSSSTSVNPPVEAPTSRPTRPADRSRTHRAPRAACARRG